MVYFFLGLMAAVPFIFLGRQVPPGRQVPRDCPKCRRQLPLLYAPWNRTRRQWVKGGFVCPACQIEVDLQGNQVAPEEPPVSTAAFLRVLIPALLAPVLVLVASCFAFHWGKEFILQRAMATEVAAELMPIARRPAPMANTFDESREEIRAQFVLHEHGLVHGGDLYSFGVEFENLSLGKAAWVEYDAQDVKLEITDDQGRIIPCSSVQRSGPVLPVCQALIPPAGYTVFSTHDQGMGIVGGQKRFNAGYEAWHLKPGEYQVKGSVLARVASSNEAHQNNDPFARHQPKLKLTIPSETIVINE